MFFPLQGRKYLSFLPAHKLRFEQERIQRFEHQHPHFQSRNPPSFNGFSVSLGNSLILMQGLTKLIPRQVMARDASTGDIPSVQQGKPEHVTGQPGKNNTLSGLAYFFLHFSSLSRCHFLLVSRLVLQISNSTVLHSKHALTCLRISFISSLYPS